MIILFCDSYLGLFNTPQQCAELLFVLDPLRSEGHSAGREKLQAETGILE